MVDKSFGGQAQLVKCGPNLVEGHHLISVKGNLKRKPTNRPTTPDLSGIPWLTAKAGKEIRRRIKKSQKEWDKKLKEWNTDRKNIISKTEEKAKIRAQKNAEKNMKAVMGKKQCIGPKCKEKIPDKKQKAGKGILLSTTFTDGGRKVVVLAYSKWTSNPQCKELKPAKKDKKIGYVMPKEKDARVGLALKELFSDHIANKNWDTIMTSPVGDIDGIGKERAQALSEILGVKTIADLLNHPFIKTVKKIYDL